MLFTKQRALRSLYFKPESSEENYTEQRKTLKCFTHFLTDENYIYEEKIFLGEKVEVGSGGRWQRMSGGGDVPPSVWGTWILNVALVIWHLETINYNACCWNLDFICLFEKPKCLITTTSRVTQHIKHVQTVFQNFLSFIFLSRPILFIQPPPP